MADRETLWLVFHDPDQSFAGSTRALEELAPFCTYISTVINKDIQAVYVRRSKDLASFLQRADVVLAILPMRVIEQQQGLLDINPFIVPVRDGSDRIVKVLVRKRGAGEASESLAVQVNDVYLLQDDGMELRAHKEVDLFTRLVVVPSNACLIPLYQAGLVDALIIESRLQTQLADDHKYYEKVREYPSISRAPLAQLGQRLTANEIVAIRQALMSLVDTPSGRDILAALDIEEFQKIAVRTSELDQPFVKSSASRPFPREATSDRGVGIKKVTAQHDRHQGKYIFTVQLDNAWQPGEAQPYIRYLGHSDSAIIPFAFHKKEGVFTAVVHEDAMARTVKKKQLPAYHIVKPGDTLGMIATRYLGKAEEYDVLATFNKLINPDLIMTGQYIKIPPQPDSSEDHENISYEIYLE